MVALFMKIVIFVAFCTFLNSLNAEKIFMTDEEFVNENEELSKNKSIVLFPFQTRLKDFQSHARAKRVGL